MKKFKLWFIIYAILFGGIVFSLMVGSLIGWFVYNKTKNIDILIFPLLPLFVVTLILAILIIALLSNYIISPLNRLIKALRQVSEGDFDVRLSEDRGLSEIRSMNMNFNRMVKELSNTETLRNDFVSNVSHEFKTPLASIEGYASLMLAPDISMEELKDYAGRIMKSTKQLSTLTGNILALSRLSTESINEKPELFSLDEQLRESILSLEPQWSGKNIDIDMDLPEVSIFSYPHMLFQVWTNIYSNAIKFSPDDSVITTELVKKDDGVYVSIEDQGIGITESQCLHIFDKFYQADTTHKSEGNGLGLSLSQKIVSLSQGTISVESEPGKGSKFTVFLPYRI